MRTLFRTLFPVLLLLLVLSIFFHWFLLRPRFERVENSRRTVEGLEHAVSGMCSTLRSLPTIAEEEVRLWKSIDQRLTATFGREDDLASALSTLADVAQSAGASLVSVTWEEPKSVAGATLKQSGTSRSGEGAPQSDRTRRATTGGSTPRQGTVSSRGTTQAAQRPRPRSVPKKASDRLPPAAAANRLASAKGRAKEAEDETMRLRAGSVTGVFHPATLQITGDYASWIRFLAGCSQACAPVLIDRVQGGPGAGAHQLDVSVRIPALDGTGEGAEARGEEVGAEPSSVAVSAELACMYHLDRLRDPLPGVPVCSAADPFPSGMSPISMFRPSRFHVSAILERNGEYVAVVNDRILSVGDGIGGVVVLKITPETVVFSLNE